MKNIFFTAAVLLLFALAMLGACVAAVCCHRGGDLARGQVVGGALQCPYHGWTFDTAGRCTRMPPLGEIREKVKRDWTVARQKDLKDAAYAKIRERYTVTVEKPEPAAAAAATPAGTMTR